MSVCYETIVLPNALGTFDVTCPDLVPHVSWQASDLATAAATGAHVVAREVQRRLELGLPLPAPTAGHRAERGGCVLGITLDVGFVRAPHPDCCTVAEAAALLNVSTSRVRALARSGRLKSNKYGNLWLISLESLNDRVTHPCRPGRPRKNGSGAA